MKSFLTLKEQKLCNEFMERGIVKIPVEDYRALNLIRKEVFNGKVKSADKAHNFVSPNDLNQFRMDIIRGLNRIPNVRQHYYSLAREALNTIVGNELVMQRNINMSIQLPNDDSSLLPIHCDTWSGDSPYEVVLWVPLVDCYETKSMFFCPKTASDNFQKKLSDFKDSEELWLTMRKYAKFIDVKYGECLIFSQNIMHGNRVNKTDETRWSMNCRFKSALSPYADKKLGEFFEPITIRPATKFGMEYEYPKVS